MLHDASPELQRQYRERLVRPRRTRLRDCLDRGVAAGLLAADADVEVAVSQATGSWNAYALSGRDAPPDWPHRVAGLIWRACSGSQ